MGCGVGRRRGSGPVLLWLWHRPAPTALIGPLAWEPPYATGAALEQAKKKKKRQKQTNKKASGKVKLESRLLTIQWVMKMLS